METFAVVIEQVKKRDLPLVDKFIIDYVSQQTNFLTFDRYKCPCCDKFEYEITFIEKRLVKSVDTYTNMVNAYKSLSIPSGIVRFIENFNIFS